MIREKLTAFSETIINRHPSYIDFPSRGLTTPKVVGISVGLTGLAGLAFFCDVNLVLTRLRPPFKEIVDQLVNPDRDDRCGEQEQALKLLTRIPEGEENYVVASITRELEAFQGQQPRRKRDIYGEPIKEKPHHAAFRAIQEAYTVTRRTR